jgi:hypothetical protein
MRSKLPDHHEQGGGRVHRHQGAPAPLGGGDDQLGEEGGRHQLHDGGRATWLHGVAEGAEGRGDHQHGAGGPVSNAVRTWNLREKDKRIIKRERGPPCTNLGGDLLGEERGPPLACLMGRSSSLDTPTTKNKDKGLLLSSSSGRFSQEEKRKIRNQEAGRDQIHHHEEERRQQESFSSSLSIYNLCTTRLTRDRTYRGCGASEIKTGSWQLPTASSTSPQDPQSRLSSSDSVEFAAKPPYFGRRTPSMDILPCSRLTDRMCSGKTLISGARKTTEPVAGYGRYGRQGNERESCLRLGDSKLDNLST